jgi:hypothetical protein
MGKCEPVTGKTEKVWVQFSVCVWRLLTYFAPFRKKVDLRDRLAVYVCVTVYTFEATNFLKKSGMKFMSLKSTKPSYFLISYNH